MKFTHTISVRERLNYCVCYVNSAPNLTQINVYELFIVMSFLMHSSYPKLLLSK